MAELTRSFEGPGIGRGGVIVVGLIILVLICLFFIPEIIEFQRSWSGDSAKKKTASASSAQRDSAQRDSAQNDLADTDSTEERGASSSNQKLAEIPAAEQPSALDRLSSLLEGHRGSKKEQKEQIDEARASLNPSSKGKHEKQAAPDKGGKGEISWDLIKSSDSKDSLLRAKKYALELSHRLPVEDDESKYALINFANGVDYIFDRGQEHLRPREAVNYIRNLDMAVRGAMTREHVDRAAVNRWQHVTFGPAIKGGAENIEAPYNASMTLTWVSLHRRMFDNQPDPRATMRVQAGGYIVADDVASIELVNRHGTVEKRIPVSRPMKETGYRLFKFSLSSNDPWTIRIKDKSGRVYQKTYDFYHGSARLPIVQNQYDLPFRMTQPTARFFAPENVDPRLDRQFTRSMWRGTVEELKAAYNYNGESAANNQLFVNF